MPADVLGNLLRWFHAEVQARGLETAQRISLCQSAQQALAAVLEAHPGNGNAQQNNEEEKSKAAGIAAGWHPQALKIEQVIAERLWQKPLRKLFLHYDVLNTGTLCPAEFRMIVERELHIKLSDEDLNHLVQKYDVDGNGVISYGEFAKQVMNRESLYATTSSLAYATALQNRTPNTSTTTLNEAVPMTTKLLRQGQLAQIRNKMKAVRIQTNVLFVKMDGNRSGLLSVPALHQGLQNYSVDIPVEDLEDLTREFQKRRPGFLTYEEFTAFVRDVSAETPLMSAQQELSANTPRMNRRRVGGSSCPASPTDPTQSIDETVKEIATRLQSKGQKMRTLFNLLDADCDGCLTVDEMCSGILKHARLRLENETAGMLIAKFDRNRDGKMRYSDFVNMLQSALRR